MVYEWRREISRELYCCTLSASNSCPWDSSRHPSPLVGISALSLYSNLTCDDGLRFPLHSVAPRNSHRNRADGSKAHVGEDKGNRAWRDTARAVLPQPQRASVAQHPTQVAESRANPHGASRRYYRTPLTGGGRRRFLLNQNTTVFSERRQSNERGSFTSTEASKWQLRGSVRKRSFSATAGSAFDAHNSLRSPSLHPRISRRRDPARRGFLTDRPFSTPPWQPQCAGRPFNAVATNALRESFSGLGSHGSPNCHTVVVDSMPVTSRVLSVPASLP